MLILKYGLQLDEQDFVSKAKANSGKALRFSGVKVGGPAWISLLRSHLTSFSTPFLASFSTSHYSHTQLYMAVTGAYPRLIEVDGTHHAGHHPCHLADQPGPKLSQRAFFWFFYYIAHVGRSGSFGGWMWLLIAKKCFNHGGLIRGEVETDGGGGGAYQLTRFTDCTRTPRRGNQAELNNS